MDVDYIQLIDDVVEFSYVLPDFLAARSIHPGRSVLKDTDMSGFIYFFLYFYQFLSCVVQHFVVRQV